MGILYPFIGVSHSSGTTKGCAYDSGQSSFSQIKTLPSRPRVGWGSEECPSDIKGERHVELLKIAVASRLAILHDALQAAQRTDRPAVGKPDGALEPETLIHVHKVYYTSGILDSST